MKILWMTWKDLKHPQAGGAELINEEIAKRLARDGHEIILLVSNFSGGDKEELRDGYKVIRLGNRYTVYWNAYRYYTKNLRGWADLVIDEMNTIPFFCKFYVRERNILLAYQLCREIWFYQMKFPLNLIGYMLEPIYLWLLRDSHVITESESAKQDMLHYGFATEKISVIPIGIIAKPLESLHGVEKFPRPTLLSLGSIRAMKRTLDQIQAFEIAKKDIPDLQLKIAGNASDSYGKKVLDRITASDYAHDIEYLGCVGEAQKTELMQKSHFILVTSVKEGWGLIVTEANSQGTPAVVYDVDGLRDSVRDSETGILSKVNSSKGMADAITRGLQHTERYMHLRKKGWLWSRELTLENCYLEFVQKANIL
ncbi:MAG: glycosyltransferase family 4 protein [Pseudobdellovibrionaceae bacterium]